MSILVVFKIVLGLAMTYAGAAVAIRTYRASAFCGGSKDGNLREIAFLLRLSAPMGVYFSLQGAIFVLEGVLSLIGG